jgi:hypothetical protein
LAAKILGGILRIVRMKYGVEKQAVHLCELVRLFFKLSRFGLVRFVPRANASGN